MHTAHRTVITSVSLFVASLVGALFFILLTTVPARAQSGPCFATHNNGTTVFSSVNAHAVQQAVDAATSGGHVKVAGTCTGVEARASTSQSAYISKTLTLSGGYTTTNWLTSNPLANPTVIDANNGGRVIFATVALTVQNITLQRGNVSSGGFTCPGAGCGGGAWAQGALTLSNVQVLSNTADSFGGGAVALGAVTATGSRFENNRSANSVGGGLYADSTLWLSDTHFISNTADSFGGGAFAIGAATATGSRFENNRSTSNSGGGLATFSSLILTNTYFISNTASGAGGGARAGDTASVVNSVFQKNSAGGAGGGLLTFSTLWLSDTHFISNTAAGFGGGAAVGGAVTATGSRFENNRSTSSDGGGLFAQSSLWLSNTHFISNTASGGGGGAFAFYAATAMGSRFENNRSTTSDGGGLFAQSSLWLSNTLFLRNRASSNGGGIFMFGLGTATGRLVNVLLVGNLASGAGNAVYANHSSGIGSDTLTILHTTIATPTFASGAAVVVQDGTAVISNTVIVSHAVGISQTGSSIVSQDYNLFFGNTADTSGGVTGGTNSLVGNPAFVNPAADDYQLTAASAAINLGANVGVFSDFFGDVRPQGGGFDAGYDESSFAATGTIVVQKATDPSPDPTNTTFTISAGGGLTPTSVSLSNGGRYTFTNVAIASGYSLTETAPAGWELTSAACSDGSPVANISISAGEVVTCTFNNSKLGSIVVRKVVVGAPPASAWQFMGPTGAFTLPTVGGSAVFTPLAVGMHTISETPQPTYAAVSACSNGASGGASVSVTLGSAQTITCTFTNTRTVGLITIIKDSTPKSTQNFNFTAGPPTPLLNGGNEGGALGAFMLDDAVPSDNDLYPKQRSFLLPNGTYTFGETPPSNWQLKSIECTANANSGVSLTPSNVAITLAGGDVTCTFKNQLSVTIQTLKYRDNNGNGVRNAGEPALAGWQITATLQPTGTPAYGPLTTNSLGRANFNFIPAGTYKVCEVLTGGWTNTQPGGASPCYTLTLNPGQTASVQFGNRQVVLPPLSSADGSQELAPLSPHPGVTITDGDPNAFDGYAVDWAAWVDANLLTPAEEPVEADATLRMYLPVVVR